MGLRKSSFFDEALTAVAIEVGNGTKDVHAHVDLPVAFKKTWRDEISFLSMCRISHDHSSSLCLAPELPYACNLGPQVLECLMVRSSLRWCSFHIWKVRKPGV